MGGNATLRSNVRVVAATNRNLEEAIVRKEFREDLYYRLNVVGIHLPPLRARVEDIAQLAEYFLSRIAQQQHRPLLKLSEEAVRTMEAYPWPGNVRELQNTLQRACVLASSDVILPKDLPLGQVVPGNESTTETIPAPVTPPLTLESAASSLFEVLTREVAKDPSVELLPWVENDFITRAMEFCGRNQVRASKLLGITRATLRKRLESAEPIPADSQAE